MNMTSDKKIKELQDKINAWQTSKTEEVLVKEDEMMLMANYLSEIEKIQKDFKRKDLAKLIGTSASYLSQVFRGDKPLNFYTIAKIQRALKIRFDVRAVPSNQSFILMDSKGLDSTPLNRIASSNLYSVKGGQQTGITDYAMEA
jgi:transcriptional regulator with XRE-family HTH domain